MPRKGKTRSQFRRTSAKPSGAPISNYAISEMDIQSTSDPYYATGTIGQRWTNPDQTATSDVTEDEKVEERSPQSWPEFADRVVQGKISIPTRTVFYIITLGWFAVASWLYAQDNQMERLQTTGGLYQYFVKFGYYSFLYLMAVIIIGISSIIRERKLKDS